MRVCVTALVTFAMFSSAAFAQPSPAAPAGTTETQAAPQVKTRQVCKRIADTNSLVRKKVCRVVPVEPDSQPAAKVEQQTGQAPAGSSGRQMTRE